MISQDHFIYDGKTYYRGTIIVRITGTGSLAKEEKEIFVRFYPERSTYLVRPFNSAKSNVLIPRRLYTESAFVRTIVRFETPSQDELVKAQELEDDLTGRHLKKDLSDLDMLLIMILILAVIAVFPPASIILIIYAFARKSK